MLLLVRDPDGPLAEHPMHAPSDPHRDPRGSHGPAQGDGEQVRMQILQNQSCSYLI